MKYTHVYVYLVGGFNHLEKYERRMGRIIPYMKWKKVPNHQPNEFLKWDYGFMVMKIGFPMDVIFTIPSGNLT